MIHTVFMTHTDLWCNKIKIMKGEILTVLEDTDEFWTSEPCPPLAPLSDMSPLTCGAVVYQPIVIHHP